MVSFVLECMVIGGAVRQDATDDRKVIHSASLVRHHFHSSLSRPSLLVFSKLFPPTPPARTVALSQRAGAARRGCNHRAGQEAAQGGGSRGAQKLAARPGAVVYFNVMLFK